MGNLSSLNMANVEAQSFSVLPVGDYKVLIAESDVAPTKAGTGHYVKAKFQIVEGEYTGRTVINIFNIDNPNPTAVEIGLGQLKACADACGIANLQDSDELTNKTCVISVGIDPKDSERNTVKGYGSAQPSLTQAPQQQAAQAASQQPQARPSFM